MTKTSRRETCVASNVNNLVSVVGRLVFDLPDPPTRMRKVNVNFHECLTADGLVQLLHHPT